MFKRQITICVLEKVIMVPVCFVLQIIIAPIVFFLAPVYIPNTFWLPFTTDLLSLDEWRPCSSIFRNISFDYFMFHVSLSRVGSWGFNNWNQIVWFIAIKHIILQDIIFYMYSNGIPIVLPKMALFHLYRMTKEHVMLLKIPYLIVQFDQHLP